MIGCGHEATPLSIFFLQEVVGREGAMAAEREREANLPEVNSHPCEKGDEGLIGTWYSHLCLWE